jgi:DNA replication protein DnaC/predicted nucleic acid-binding Zn ribbon protein
MNTECRKCGAAIEYEPIPDWPGIVPSICDGCGEIHEREQRRNRAFEILRYGQVPEAYWQFDEAKGNAALLAWCYQRRNKSIWLAGSTGTGKTRCLCRTAARVAWTDQSVVIAYRAAFDWLRALGSIMGKDGNEAEAEIHRAKMASILILDDLGQEKLTERGAEVVFSVLDFRIRENRRCWITTNGTAAELDSKLGTDRGRAIRRRLAENCEQWS